MSTHYECECCRTLDSICPDHIILTAPVRSLGEDPAQGDLPTEVYDPSTDIEEIIQNLANKYFAASNEYSQLMSTLYQSGALHPESMYGTEDHVVMVLHNPSDHGPGAELVGGREIPQHVITIPIEHVRQATESPEGQLPSSPPATQALCPAAFCRWLDKGTSGPCGTMISCDDVPAHFKNIHGITNMKEFELIECRWGGLCSIRKRKNFVRHIRERHLSHSREKGHSS
ncbi:hypothetical protein OG21DRAFT_1519859 [Imleria badia]|nr:hypothetical protein OG21DRAFT_1519859 [Imleria badia]